MGQLRRWDAGPDEWSDEPDWAAHEARAGALAAAVRPFSARSELYSSDHAAAIAQWIGAARGEPPEVIRSLLLLLIRRAGAEGGWSHDATWRVHGLRLARHGVPARDAAYALRTAAELPDTWWASDVLACAGNLASRADDPADRRLLGALAEFTASVTAREYVTGPDRAAIARKVSRLAPAPPASAPLDTTAIRATDGWSAAVLSGLAGWTGPAYPVNVLLHHLRSASRSRATRSWLAQAADVLAAPAARQVLRLMLEAAASAGGVQAPDRFGWGLANLVVSGQNAELLRAAGWAAAVVDEEWTVPVLTSLARRGISGTSGTSGSGQIESSGVAAACVASLGQIASATALASLADLHGAATDAGLRKKISDALRVAARRAGLGPGELAERIVPRAGLDAQGERVVTAGPVAARVRLEGREPQVRWRGGRGWVRRPPAGSAGAEPAVRLAVRELTRALAGERARLEGLLAQDRSWAVADWRALYCEHPVTAAIARDLVWTFHSPAEPAVAAVLSAEGKLATPDDMREIPAQGTVRLWHPVRAQACEIGAWRDFLVAAGREQPFEQVRREVCLLTPAEQASPAHSDRHAGRLLRYQQLFALLGERGWRASYLDPYEGHTSGQACRDYPQARLTAVFEHQATGSLPGDLQVERCRAGSLSFCRATDRARKPVRLDKVPDLVFSEAMRDIGLLVAMTAEPAG